MKFYTKKWYDYVYKNYEKYTSYLMTIRYKEEVDSIEYNADLLINEFNKYYHVKEEYVSKYEYLEKEFGEYEKIELLSYDEELKLYNEKLNNFVKNALEIIDKEDRYDNLENDLYLFALNKITKNFHKILEKGFLRNNNFKNINAFLTSYYEYFNTRKDSFDFNLVFNHSFHDGIIREYKEIGNDIVIVVDDEYNNRFTFTIKDAKYNKINFEGNINSIIGKDIMSLSCYNFEDKKYYIYLEIPAFTKVKSDIQSVDNISDGNINYMDNFNAFVNDNDIFDFYHFSEINDSIEFWSDKIYVSKQAISK